MPTDDETWAQGLSKQNLVREIRSISLANLTPANRAALAEAARRLENERPPSPGQFIVTLEDGRQVAYMHGAVHVRSTIGGLWPSAMTEVTRPHQPRTWYQGEW